MNNIKSGLIHKEYEYAIRAWSDICCGENNRLLHSWRIERVYNSILIQLPHRFLVEKNTSLEEKYSRIACGLQATCCISP